MQFHLTRFVIRQILRNKPLSHIQCCKRVATWGGRGTVAPTGISRTTSRSLFGFSRKPQREPRRTDLDPGFLALIDLNNKLAVRARPPAADTIKNAFRDLFTSKLKSDETVEELQCEHAITAVYHLRGENLDRGDSGISTEDLLTALRALRRRKGQVQQEKRLELAGLIFEELQSRRKKAVEEFPNFEGTVFHTYIDIIAGSGQALQARELVQKFWEAGAKEENKPMWLAILRGFASQQNDEEVSRTIEIMKANGVAFTPEARYALVNSCLEHNNLALAKSWYALATDDGEAPGPRLEPRTNRIALKMCIRHMDYEWGQELVAKILDQTPEKKGWDTIFQWAAANGKGVDEIERMMNVMVERNKKEGISSIPDTDTINGLIELANFKNDPYTAERYLSLAHKWRIPLNAETHLLQMDYRIKVGDLDGANHVYQQLKAYEVGNRDLPLINKLILALCNHPRPDYDTIMEIVNDLTERNTRLEPVTVSALSLLQLQRKELHEVIDLLQSHVFHYELEERAFIRDSMVDFCLDRSNNTSMAWDAYTILRQLFDETDRDTRTRLMNEFFARGRADMGMHVFGHMRQSPLPEKRPTTSTYAQCLEGIAKTPDMSSVETVHNMIKLDYEIEPDTHLYNGLMIAYSACGAAERAMDFWEDIIYSREGPTYNSIRIALRACELMPYGQDKAKDIWKRLKKFEIEINKDIYAAYVAALAGNMLIEESLDMLDKMEAEIGVPPDPLT
jgi:hypothetical protein